MRVQTKAQCIFGAAGSDLLHSLLSTVILEADPCRKVPFLCSAQSVTAVSAARADLAGWSPALGSQHCPGLVLGPWHSVNFENVPPLHRKITFC